MQAFNEITLDWLLNIVEYKNLLMALDYPDDRVEATKEYLLEHDIVTPNGPFNTGVTCHSCGIDDIILVRSKNGQYEGCCSGFCNWVPLTPIQARFCTINIDKVVQWLAIALKLTQHHQPKDIYQTCLWRLGETEYRRKRYTLFYGRALHRADGFDSAISEHSAPNRRIVLTTTPLEEFSVTDDTLFVSLKAVCHLRTGGFVIENIETYLDQKRLDIGQDETSLRLLESKRVALIDGQAYPLAPLQYHFLQRLKDAEGQFTHKSIIASHLETDADTFKPVQLFKRNKAVYQAFIENDSKGSYRLSQPI